MSADVSGDKTVVGPGDQTAAPKVDPRTMLAIWANKKDEWVRSLVGEIIQSGIACGRGTDRWGVQAVSSGERARRAHA